jgi:hypothetical protein
MVINVDDMLGDTVIVQGQELFSNEPELVCAAVCMGLSSVVTDKVLMKARVYMFSFFDSDSEDE